MRVTRLAVAVAIPGVIFALSKIHAAWVAPDPYDFTSSSRVIWAIGMALVTWVSAYAVGLPSLVDGRRQAIVAAVVAVGASVAFVSLAQLLLGDALLPRFVVFGSALVLIPVLTGLGLLGASGRRRVASRDRVLFVGGRAEALQLQGDLHGSVERPAVLLAAMLVDEALDRSGGAPLAARVEAIGANVLVLDVAAQAEVDIVAQAAHVHERGVRVRTLSMFYEDWLGKLPLTELERVSLLFDIGELHRARYARMKRVVDVVAGVFGTIVLLVVTPVVLVGNLVANRGPLMFRQERIGKGGQPFTILKFRTMRPGTTQGEWTSVDDARVTTFGGWLRRSHIDELPQIVNILRGDLSLVGPRPEQARYVRELEEKLPFYGVRHLVRPGLTGWAQVKYGYASDTLDALQKLQYEFFYLRHQSLALDAQIVGRTLRHLGTGGGR
ncbi:sugar transferase [Actinomarinicola tropica]|uniref:Bacterial sugar transferase domain-containing protein n=1 Tax=Actinomarinicola tropica TaxID=2789776 RepID=A0A5Q2RF69_9ACTN|nr:sugar transferase [Actinomarinicola tropica]QGG95469.1 hypothetical protein GH723_10365 [Actinomarinicola tropica]